VELFFLESSEQVLVRRYRETRRVHPLSPDGSVEQGIAAERQLLRDVALLADRTIDTSQLNVHQLKAAIVQGVSGQSRPTVVNLVSFGYRYGTPDALELLFDVRFLPNPYFVESLSASSGLEPHVARFVMDNDDAREFLRKSEDLLAFTLPRFEREGKAYLTVAIGCTGGRHRSVAVAEELGRRLGDRWPLTVRHRDLGDLAESLEGTEAQRGSAR